MSIVYLLIVFLVGVIGGFILCGLAWVRKEAGTVLVASDEDGPYLFLETTREGMDLIEQEKYVMFTVKKMNDTIRFSPTQK